MLSKRDMTRDMNVSGVKVETAIPLCSSEKPRKAHGIERGDNLFAEVA